MPPRHNQAPANAKAVERIDMISPPIEDVTHFCNGDIDRIGATRRERSRTTVPMGLRCRVPPVCLTADRPLSSASYPMCEAIAPGRRIQKIVWHKTTEFVTYPTMRDRSVDRLLRKS